MNNKTHQHMVVGLDIGTSKIVATVAAVDPQGTVDIIGHGQASSHGLKNGMVVNIEATTDAIQQAINQAENASECRIHSVIAGISGCHIQSHNSRGVVRIQGQEVSARDMRRVLESAQIVALTSEQAILHALPQQFAVDQQQGIPDPLGMAGVRLEVQVHLVVGQITATQNMTRCVRQCRLEMEDMILQPLASGEAVLKDDEKDMGVVLVDIGGGTTDVAIYHQGSIQHTAVIPFAGDELTRDLSNILQTPLQDAEQLKKDHGACLVSAVDGQQIIDVTSVGNRPSREITRGELVTFLQRRHEELLSKVNDVLQASGFATQVPAGLVFTGGGAQMEGLLELSEVLFELPARLGFPSLFANHGELYDPRFATVAGLLKYGIRAEAQPMLQSNMTHRQGILRRMRQWFSH